MNMQLDFLPVIENNDFVLEFIPSMSYEYAKTLVGKNILFQWKHDGNVMTITGKVMGYKKNNLLVYKHYVLMPVEDLGSTSSDYIEWISFKNINNITEFDAFIPYSWEKIPKGCYQNKICKITNVKESSITALVYAFDGFNIYYLYKKLVDGKESIRSEFYSAFLIKTIAPTCACK